MSNLGVFSGSPLSELFDKEKIIPSTFSQMIKVGEETGNMEEMFESISNYYQEELDNAVQRLTAMLEPIMIVFMGGTIGFIIIAMYLPIFHGSNGWLILPIIYRISVSLSCMVIILVY